MKFIITRTSVWDFENYTPPCKEAKKEVATIYYDRRTVPTLDEARKKEHSHWANDWFKQGKNHREEGGLVVCDVPGEYPLWTIEINSLDELIKFKEKEGNLIIGTEDDYEGYNHTIEIYDGYRE